MHCKWSTNWDSFVPQIVGSDGYENDIDGVTQQMIELIENVDISGLSVTANKATTAGVAVANGAAVSSAENISMSTVDEAASAIGNIDIAIQTLNSQRATLGSFSNRLDSTVSNLTSISANL